ncbi:MAG: hypothetical protein CM15mP49_25420 [Actinomycetota bacterium]|nr:MAG: hypothetical protein CM15mP49_25420 [Actinomycetota bacterium]
MKPKKTDYTDVSDVGITDEKRERLYKAQTECVVNWTNREGWPVGVMHRFVWHDENSGSRVWNSGKESQLFLQDLKAQLSSRAKGHGWVVMLLLLRKPWQ